MVPRVWVNTGVIEVHEWVGMGVQGLIGPRGL